MKTLASTLKSMFLGGVLVVLPLWLAVLLLLKGIMQLQIFVKPVSTHLPQAIQHPLLVAVAIILLGCFLAGAAMSTAFGRHIKEVVDQKILERLPGYTTLRGLAEQIADTTTNHGFQPALIEMGDGLAPGFIVEEHASGQATVFIPSSPTPAAGQIFIVQASQVHPVDVPVSTAFSCITHWGAGSGKMLAGMKSVASTPRKT